MKNSKIKNTMIALTLVAAFAGFIFSTGCSSKTEETTKAEETTTEATTEAEETTTEATTEETTEATTEATTEETEADETDADETTEAGEADTDVTAESETGDESDLSGLFQPATVDDFENEEIKKLVQEHLDKEEFVMAVPKSENTEAQYGDAFVEGFITMSGDLNISASVEMSDETTETSGSAEGSDFSMSTVLLFNDYDKALEAIKQSYTGVAEQIKDPALKFDEKETDDGYSFTMDYQGSLVEGSVSKDSKIVSIKTSVSPDVAAQ